MDDVHVDLVVDDSMYSREIREVGLCTLVYESHPKLITEISMANMAGEGRSSIEKTPRDGYKRL